MKHRILMILTIASLIFTSSCTINIVQAPASSDAGKTYPSLPAVDLPSPSQTPEAPTDPEFLDDVSTKDDDELLCEPFEFPELDEVPQFPYVPPEMRGDDEYVSALLIKHLDALTLFIERTDAQIRSKYEKYLKDCR